ncbi:glycosyltransferase [Escherichia coli]
MSPLKRKLFFMLGVSSLTKAYCYLMQSFEKLAAAHKKKNLKLVVIGDYTEMSKSDKGAYQRNVREIAKRLKDRCIMLGSIPPEKMHCYYPLADLVVIPSQFQEPFCMVAIEAMGAGKPV